MGRARRLPDGRQAKDPAGGGRQFFRPRAAPSLAADSGVKVVPGPRFLPLAAVNLLLYPA